MARTASLAIIATSTRGGTYAGGTRRDDANMPALVKKAGTETPARQRSSMLVPLLKVPG